MNEDDDFDNPDEILHVLLTIRDYIRYGASQFTKQSVCFGHGYDNAWDESLNLVLNVIHFPIEEADDRILDARLTLQERKDILNFFTRRTKERIPSAYLTRVAWFAGYPFYVDERVIVPRSPIGEVIQKEFFPWIERENVAQILDLCTGSGCIALACALTFKEVQVDAIDISEEALAVAEINVTRYALQNQVQLIQSDLFSALDEQRYDIIVSNPPYVKNQDVMTLPTEYHFEPALALKGGMSGLDLVFRILTQARDYLTPHGILMVEVGEGMDLLEQYCPNVPFTWLEFDHGDDGVFLLTADQLEAHQDTFETVLCELNGVRDKEMEL